MDWSYEKVLEFIELLEEEPCIWNPKSKHHKNRNLVNDAWTRITSKFSVSCSIEELKKKRNTLLTQYRECLKKIKESTITGSGTEEIYRPSWFAFDAINHYMGTLYDCPTKISTKTKIKFESPLSHEGNSVESNVEVPISCELNNKRSVSRESSQSSDSVPVPKRQRGAQDMLIAKKQMNEPSALMENRCSCRENEKEANECDLYGQLLAQKLKILDVDDRLMLMNEIDNIVYKYFMNVRKRNSSEGS